MMRVSPLLAIGILAAAFCHRGGFLRSADRGSSFAGTAEALNPFEKCLCSFSCSFFARFKPNRGSRSRRISNRLFCTPRVTLAAVRNEVPGLKELRAASPLRLASSTVPGEPARRSGYSEVNLWPQLTILRRLRHARSFSFCGVLAPCSLRSRRSCWRSRT